MSSYDDLTSHIIVIIKNDNNQTKDQYIYKSHSRMITFNLAFKGFRDAF